MLVLGHHHRVAFALGHAHRGDFLVKKSGLLSGHCLALAGQGHAVLGFTFNAVFRGHVLCRLGHGVHTILRLHFFVHKAPANGGVMNFRVAPKCAVRFGHDKGCAAHAFHTTCDHQLGLTRADGTRCRSDGVQTRTAQAVDGGPRHTHRQASQQAGHVGHVAVVLTRLVHAAINHIGHGGPIDLGVARHQGHQRHCSQIIGAHRRQSPPITTTRGANGVTNEGVIHGGPLTKKFGDTGTSRCAGWRAQFGSNYDSSPEAHTRWALPYPPGHMHVFTFTG